MISFMRLSRANEAFITLYRSEGYERLLQNNEDGLFIKVG